MQNAAHALTAHAAGGSREGLEASVNKKAKMKEGPSASAPEL